MNQRIFAIFTVLSLASSVHARLGETEVQLEARFGKPVKGHPDHSDAALVLSQLSSTLWFGPLKPEKGTMDILARWDWNGFAFKAYNLDSFRLLVLLKDGKSVFEEISDKTATKFDKAKLDALLAANADGLTWSKVPSDLNITQQWYVEDPKSKVKTRFAILNGGNTIGFYTSDLIDFLNKTASSIKAGKLNKESEAIKKF